jgi:hypothetical protein
VPVRTGHLGVVGPPPGRAFAETVTQALNGVLSDVIVIEVLRTTTPVTSGGLVTGVIGLELRRWGAIGRLTDVGPDRPILW